MTRILWPQHKALALAPIVFVYMAVVVYYAAGNTICRSGSPLAVGVTSCNTFDLSTAALAWYVVWSASCYVSYFVWLATWMSCLYLLWRSIRACIDSLPFCGALFAILLAWSFLSYPAFNALFRYFDVLRASPAAVFPAYVFDHSNPKILHVAGTTNSLLKYGFSAGLFTTYLACAVLLLPSSFTQLSKEDQAALLGTRLSYLRLALYLCAGVMAVGILRLLSFSEFFLAAFSLDALRPLIHSMMFFTSAYYTIMISAMYLSAAAILHTRVEKLLAGATGEQRLNWLGHHGTLRLHAAMFTTLLGVLSPMLSWIVTLCIGRILALE